MVFKILQTEKNYGLWKTRLIIVLLKDKEGLEQKGCEMDRNTEV